ncbi:MAG: hypothetical protein HY862_02660 [Chloroflexi bacterium]|nr:hypothetical protein [Chloroflexota bacterium]
MDKKRFRTRFVFWLDLQKQDENQIAEQIETLKQERAFAKVIRDGIRLICDLRAGKTDVLLELFPWVAERFQPQNDTSELTALVEQFKTMMVNNRSVVVAQAPAWNPPLPMDNKLEVRVVENEEERKKLSVKNTLAALEDF